MRLRRMQKTAALLITAALLAVWTCAGADLPWPAERNTAQRALADYIGRVNTLIADHGEMPVNSLFGCWPTLAVLGVTAEDNAEVPEDVEITFSYTQEHLLYLELRACDTARFPGLCAAMILGAAGDSMTWDEALATPAAYAARAAAKPETSFSEPVLYDPGPVPRTYYAYEPDTYHDGRNWLTMTLIFPRSGETGAVTDTPIPEDAGEHRPLDADEDERDPAWVGYDPPLGEAPHYEIFVTPTPEPDSAVYPY